MKRHGALHPLSRDHHNVLVHARRLRGLDARIDGATARRRFLSYFAGVLALHFDEEEAILAPRITDPALRKRLIDEHADLRQRTLQLGIATADQQVELGQKLREHVRFEEDVLFPHLESTLGEADLQAVADATAANRQATRPASLTPGAEACFL